MPQVLVVDDQELMRETLEETFRTRGYEVDAVTGGGEALEALRAAPYDVVVTDLQMPGMDGLQLLAAVRKEFGEEVAVILITAYGTVPTAVSAMKEGAFDYIQKPFKADEITVVVERAIRHKDLVQENAQLRRELSGSGEVELVAGNSSLMRKLAEDVSDAADSPATVLITGESGTGKEIVARTLHKRGARASSPFIAVNCAALSAGLLESELFGHEKGSFTGAHERRKGRFELADGGTLLLDEVSEIDPQLQAKLLRVLQEKSFERVGSSKTINVDVRVVATTNRDLKEEIKEGRFRRDLYYRLNVLPLHVPALRERPEDIEPLARHFLNKHAWKTRFAEWEIEPETLESFRSYAWPGNIRELENTVERGMIVSKEPRLSVKMTGEGFDPSVDSGRLDIRGLTLEEMEKLAIKDALERFGGHQQKTADALGIAVRTLRGKIKKWNLK